MAHLSHLVQRLRLKINARIGQLSAYSSVLTLLITCFAAIFWLIQKPDESTNSREIVAEKLDVSPQETQEFFEGDGFTPTGPLGTEPNIPPGYKDRDYQKADYRYAAYMSDGNRTNLLQPTEQKIVLNFFATIETKDVKNTADKLRIQVQQLGGIIERESLRQDNGEKLIANIAIRVKAEIAAKFFNELSNHGSIKSQQVMSTDITKKHRDTKLRLENQMKLRATLLRILQQRTGSVKEVIEGTKELTEVTESIESLQGEMNILEDQIALSTVSITIHEPSALLAGRNESIWRKFFGSFIGAGYLFIDFISLLIKSMGVILPLGLLGFWLYRRKSRNPADVKTQKKGKTANS